MLKVYNSYLVYNFQFIIFIQKFLLLFQLLIGQRGVLTLKKQCIHKIASFCNGTFFTILLNFCLNNNFSLVKKFQFFLKLLNFQFKIFKYFPSYNGFTPIMGSLLIAILMGSPLITILNTLFYNKFIFNNHRQLD